MRRKVGSADLGLGHARALVTASNASELAQIVVSRGLSVRQVEKLMRDPGTPNKVGTARTNKDADTRALEGDLSAALKMSVRIAHNIGQEGGFITIKYQDLEQLDELCRHLASS